MPTSVDELLPTRASLLSRLKQWDDQDSWQDFFSTYWKLIYNVAFKAGLDDAAAQDVVQETIIAVAKSIRDFKYDPRTGSFKGWLLTLTRRRISDHLRRKQCRPNLTATEPQDRENGPSLLEQMSDTTQDWEKLWNEEWDRNLLEVALDTVKKRVKARQYQLFDCFVLKEWPMDEITSKLRVNMGQVYFAKYKVSLLLQSEIRTLRRRWS